MHARSKATVVASLLMAASSAVTLATGLPPLGLDEPTARRVLSVLLAAIMLALSFGTYRLRPATWLSGMLFFGANAAFAVAMLVIGPRPAVAWFHAASGILVAATLALPSARAAFHRAAVTPASPEPPAPSEPRTPRSRPRSG